jgi:hypothetical protein
MTTKNEEEKFILEPTEEELAEYTAMACCPEFDDYSDAFQIKHYGKIVYSREEREADDKIPYEDQLEISLKNFMEND